MRIRASSDEKQKGGDAGRRGMGSGETGAFPSVLKEGNALASTAVIDFEIAFRALIERPYSGSTVVFRRYTFVKIFSGRIR
jgi:hypothetical protein